MDNALINKVKEFITPVYMVGGSVRDMLLGKEPKDYDFCTPLLPEEIENCIKKSGKKAYLVGKRFGTIGCKVDGQMVEITTFRTEKYKDGNRKPEVSFISDLREDLARRDFTINSLAYDGINVIDYFDGEKDLKRPLIKCVGKANERFKEDPLRLLRACRFTSQLGCGLEEYTYEMMKELNYKILEISKERWVSELDKLLIGERVDTGLNLLERTRLLNYIIPELSLQVDYEQNNPHHTLTLWEHTKKVVMNTPLDIEMRWGALFHDIAKPFMRKDKSDGTSNYHKHDLVGAECVLKIADYLKWSNERKNNVYNLVLHHMDDNSPLRKADMEAK